MRLALSRCTVRPWAKTDLDALVTHANNRRVSAHLRDRFPYPYEREHARRFLAWIAQQASPTVWCLEVDGEAAGGIGIELHTDVERVSAEMGYWLGESAWGRGVATEALRAVTAEAIRQFDLTPTRGRPTARSTSRTKSRRSWTGSRKRPAAASGARRSIAPPTTPNAGWPDRSGDRQGEGARPPP